MKSDDLISRSALIEYFEKLALSLANAECYAAADATQTAAETLRLAPSIDAEPVRHGRWIDDMYFDEPVTRCTACKCGFAKGHKAERFRYCPNCGAKMDATT